MNDGPSSWVLRWTGLEPGRNVGGPWSSGPMVGRPVVVDGISIWVGDAGRSNGEGWWRLGYGKWIGREKKDGCCAAREWSMGLLEMGKLEAQVVGMERLAR
ncbi:hypothetical protein V6N13_106327 [Hibiscus sabdariffa]